MLALLGVLQKSVASWDIDGRSNVMHLPPRRETRHGMLYCLKNAIPRPAYGATSEIDDTTRDSK